MSERLNLVEERRAISRLRALLRATEQMKAAQRTSNKSGIVYYETKSTQEYDAMIPVTYDSTFPSGRIIKIETTFTARKQQWPYVLFLPQFYVGANPDTLAGAQPVTGSIIDQSSPDINKLEVPYQLAFSATASIDNPQPGQTKYVYAKCIFLGTDKGSFSMKASLL
jgi:hypothetical protein|nr:MAG TPA: hypothetical protein [Bacteriophage sp.]